MTYRRFRLTTGLVWVFVLGVLVSLAGPATAIDTLYWDTSDSNGLQGGAGYWYLKSDTAGGRAWTTSSSGSSSVGRLSWGWNSDAKKSGENNKSYNGSDAIFLASGGAVTVVNDCGTVDPVNVNSITFSNTGYTIQGGTLTLTGSDITTSSDATINAVLTGSVQLHKHGSAVLTLGGANSYTGGTLIDCGTLRLGASDVLPDYAVTVTGATLDVNGMTDTIGSLTLTDATVIGAGGLTLGGIFTSSGTSSIGTTTLDLADSDEFDISGDLSVTSNIHGVGRGIRKKGAGVLTLHGANTYSGDTTVTAGTLKLAKGASIDKSPNISISSSTHLDVSSLSGFGLARGQKLKGVGSLIGAATISNAATIAPGSSAGTLHTDDLTISDNATYEWELGSTLTDYDVVSVTGGLSLPNAGTITLKLFSLDGLDPTGQTFDIITWTGVDPTYTNAVWNLDYGTTGWTGGAVTVDTVNDKVVLGFISVPEPGTLVLLGLGASGLIWRRRRRSIPRG